MKNIFAKLKWKWVCFKNCRPISCAVYEKGKKYHVSVNIIDSIDIDTERNYITIYFRDKTAYSVDVKNIEKVKCSK